MKSKIRKIITIWVTVSGFVLMLYPWLGEKINQKNASKVIDGYRKEVKNYPEEKKKQIRKEAEVYNRKILNSNVIMTDPFDEEAQKITMEEYVNVLNMNGSGMIGYLDIDKIGVHLPIYHGTSQEVLKKYVGHLPETSLPIRGTGVHSVLSAHTGMSNAKLFSDLDKLQKGDGFQIQVLEERLNYEVYEIETVLPEEVSSLEVKKDENKCTLITCTPYGINTHRLLVHGRLVNMRKKKTEKKRTPTVLFRIIAAVSVLTGICICLYPYLCRRDFNRTMEEEIRAFDLTAKEKEKNFWQLRTEMERYNRRLVEEGQAGLKDAWSYETPCFELTSWGLRDNMTGYLKIPAVNLKLPVYLGRIKRIWQRVQLICHRPVCQSVETVPIVYWQHIGDMPKQRCSDIWTDSSMEIRFTLPICGRQGAIG